MRDEDDSIMDLKHVEEMMRASQKSNIFSAIPQESADRHSSAVRETTQATHFSNILPASSDRNSIIKQQ